MDSGAAVRWPLILIPNFFFHIGTVHAILRSKGLPVGKKDQVGELAKA